MLTKSTTLYEQTVDLFMFFFKEMRLKWDSNYTIMLQNRAAISWARGTKMVRRQDISFFFYNYYLKERQEQNFAILKRGGDMTVRQWIKGSLDPSII